MLSVEDFICLCQLSFSLVTFLDLFIKLIDDSCLAGYFCFGFAEVFISLSMFSLEVIEDSLAAAQLLFKRSLNERGLILK